MFNADDLCLLSPNPSYLQGMLKELERYAEAKGLTINVAKSEVVNFNDNHRQPLAPFSYKGTVLETREEFKYLGQRFPELDMVRRAEQQWAQSLLVASNNALRMANHIGSSIVWTCSYAFLTRTPSLSPSTHRRSGPHPSFFRPNCWTMTSNAATPHFCGLWGGSIRRATAGPPC